MIILPRPYVLDALNTVHDRHEEVAEDEVVAVLLHALEALEAVGGGLDVEVFVLDGAGEGLADGEAGASEARRRALARPEWSEATEERPGPLLPRPFPQRFPPLSPVVDYEGAELALGDGRVGLRVGLGLLSWRAV